MKGEPYTHKMYETVGFDLSVFSSRSLTSNMMFVFISSK